MPQMGLRYEIGEDRDSLVLTLLKESDPLGHIIFDAATLDDFIHGLAAYRKLMKTGPVAEAEPERMTANPPWAVFADRAGSGVVLSLQRPGLGWLSFGLEQEQARAMAEAFLQHLDRPRGETQDRQYRR